MSDTITQEKKCRSCEVSFTASMSKLLGRFPMPVSTFRHHPEKCPSCSEAFHRETEAIARRRNLNFDQDEVKSFFTANPPVKGDTLILAMGQFYRNAYILVRIINPESGRQKRIIIDKGDCYGGASYYRNGKSTFAPKGQTRLRPYVESVGAQLSYDVATVLSDENLAELLAL